VDTGLTSNDVYALAIKGDTVFAGTEYGICLSVNIGNHWDSVNTGLKYDGALIAAFAMKGDTIFAGDISGNGVLLSSNNGGSWKYVDSGLTGYALYVNALAISENKIFAGTGCSGCASGGLYISSNGGISWSLAAFGSMVIKALAVKGDTIFVGTYGDGVYVSKDTGHTWSSKSTGLPYSGLSVFSLLIKENYIFAGTAYGVYVSSINGGNWVAINDGFPFSPVDTNLLVQQFFALAANDSYIFAGGAPYSGEAGQAAGVWRRPLSQVITGVNEVKNKEYNIAAYPNPVNDNLIVEVLPQTTIEIYNIQGQLMKAFTADKNKSRIDVSVFPCGVYVVEAKAEKGIAVKKFVKE
jgi:hypothetical protein